MTDHYLLMTATPHKGDPENFCLFLALLDTDVYGNIKSLQEAMRRHEAPFYLRRTKEALVTFPDPETGTVHKLFTKREVRTAAFDLDGDELDFYDELTRYVEDQSIKAAADDIARGPGRRLHDGHAPAPHGIDRSTPSAAAWSGCGSGARRSSQTPKPTARSRSTQRVPDDFDDLTEEEQQEIIAQLEDEVASADPAALREEIARLTQLIDQARILESARDRVEAHQAQERPQRNRASSPTRR